MALFGTSSNSVLAARIERETKENGYFRDCRARVAKFVRIFWIFQIIHVVGAVVSGATIYDTFRISIGQLVVPILIALLFRALIERGYTKGAGVAAALSALVDTFILASLAWSTGIGLRDLMPYMPGYIIYMLVMIFAGLIFAFLVFGNRLARDHAEMMKKLKKGIPLRTEEPEEYEILPEEDDEYEEEDEEDSEEDDEYEEEEPEEEEDRDA